jgi:hypothetical protein
MNKKGVLQFLGVMMFMIVIIMAIVFIEPIKDQVTTARSPSNLDCDNASISTEQQMSCIITGSTLWAFLGVMIASAIGWLGIREFRSKQGEQ